MRVLLLLFLLIPAGGLAAAAPDPATLQSAERVAKLFLGSIDAGNPRNATRYVYEREHRDPQSGRVRRSPVVATPSEVAQRQRYGRVRSRTLQAAELLRTYPGFADGAFVRFTYAVRYERRAGPVTETLVIKADNPQRWKVVAF